MSIEARHKVSMSSLYDVRETVAHPGPYFDLNSNFLHVNIKFSYPASTPSYNINIWHFKNLSS